MLALNEFQDKDGNCNVSVLILCHDGYKINGNYTIPEHKVCLFLSRCAIKVFSL